MKEKLRKIAETAIDIIEHISNPEQLIKDAALLLNDGHINGEEK